MKQFVILLCLLLSGGFVASKNLHQRSTRSDECAATNVNIAQFGTGLFVTWTVTDATECPLAVRYMIQYEINDIVNEIDASLVNGGVIENVELSCTKIDVTVVTVDANHEVIGATATTTYNPTLPPVSIISVGQTDAGISIAWVQPEYAERCSLTYTVGHQFEGDTPEEDADILEPNFVIPLNDATPCVSVNIWITAVSGVFTSSRVAVDFETGIGKVEGFTLVNEDGAVVADFKQPGDLGNCGVVSYRVVQKEESCFRSRFTVKPVSDRGTVGQLAENVIDIGPGPVLDLTAIVNGDKLLLQWRVPTDGEGCDLAYLVTYRDASVATTHMTEYELTSATKACESDDITVTPISGVSGVGSVMTYKGELGMVNNFVCTPNAPSMVCSWAAPTDSEACTEISYSIRYSNGVTTGSTDTDQLTFTFTPQNCENSWVSIEPQSGDTKGHPFERSFSETDCQAFNQGRRRMI